jgi:hypothetical protein
MKPLITDDQRLVSATGRFGHAIKVYDDGFGPLWIHRDSTGISGIVRAQTWEEAYSICEDEFFPACDLTMEEIVKEYGFRRESFKVVRDSTAPVNDADQTSAGERRVRDDDYVDHRLPYYLFVRWHTRSTPDPEAWMDNELFQEAYGFRGNGRKEPDGTISHIYAKDLNGDSLDCLTPELLATLEITLQIENNE